MMYLGFKVNGGRRVLCVLLVRVWGDTVLKATEMSRRVKAAASPQSMTGLMSSVAVIRLVLVLWFAQNPHLDASRILWFSRYSVIWWLIPFSITLAGK